MKADYLAQSSADTGFGSESFRRIHFSHHKSGVHRLNHGSFGSAPQCVLSVQKRFLDEWNAQPDEVYFDKLENGLIETERILAKLVNCSKDNICLVDNASTGAAIVTDKISRELKEKSLKGTQESVILIHSFIYEGLAKMFKQRFESIPNVRIETVELAFPIKNKNELIKAYQEKLESLNGVTISLALVDFISSMPAAIFPVAEICSLLRQHSNVEEIFVDGAHALGMVPIDLEEIDCDYLTSNAHKWLFCPTSVAFLYFKDKAKADLALHHPVCCHNFGQGLAAECRWIGTRDYSSMMTVPSAVEFIEYVGGLGKIRQYQHSLCVEVAKYISNEFNTKIGCSEDMIGALVMVGLPSGLSKRYSDPLELRHLLRSKYNIECYTWRCKTDGSYWLRVSAQIYNSLHQYKYLCECIKDILL
eukprot:Nk52_evm76s221 gene=Nk52_evmTU76s221